MEVVVVVTGDEVVVVGYVSLATAHVALLQVCCLLTVSHFLPCFSSTRTIGACSPRIRGTSWSLAVILLLWRSIYASTHARLSSPSKQGSSISATNTGRCFVTLPTPRFTHTDLLTGIQSSVMPHNFWSLLGKTQDATKFSLTNIISNPVSTTISTGWPLIRPASLMVVGATTC